MADASAEANTKHLQNCRLTLQNLESFITNLGKLYDQNKNEFWDNFEAYS